MRTLLSIITFVSLSTAFAKSTGKVEVYNLQIPADAKVIKITGAAASELYRSYSVDEVLQLDVDTKQKVGKNISCIKVTDDNKPSKYSCEITILKGAVQPGAAG